MQAIKPYPKAARRQVEAAASLLREHSGKKHPAQHLGSCSPWWHELVAGEALWPPWQLARHPGPLARPVAPSLRFRGWGEQWAAP